MASATDTHIIEALKANPQRGFKLLMDRYEKPLYWHIRRLVVDYDDAKDATQETLIRIFKSLSSYSGGSFSAWLYRIATNEALRMIACRKDTPLPLDLAADVTGDSYFNFSDAEAVLLQKAIHSLPPKQQAAFNMRYYDEMDYDTIGEALGSSAEAAKTNYHLAKEKIVNYMTQNG